MTLPYKKSSARVMERTERIEGLNLLSNVLPANWPDLYVYDATSQAIIYEGNNFTDPAGMS